MAALKNLFIRAIGGSAPGLALVPAPSRALQIIAKNDEAHSMASKPMGDFRELDRHAAASWVALLQSEIDLRFFTVERIVAEQAEALRSLRDLAIEFEAKMACLSRNIETLCEKAGAENLEMMSEEQKAEVARRKMKAMFAFVENSEPMPQPAPPAEPVHIVHCPKCLSADTRQAKRLSMLDRCLRAMSMNARRCRTCGSRFYRIRWTAFTGIGKGPRAGRSR